ncbi:MAG: gamma-glutamyl-gamma-aminobutyrate hydrolase family protein, partial [Bacteroidota bacterium]|nr:gamma-glutamyl-gamma-aminobutyrate hydrolase family protein [Bacteroidota bacterium]
TEMNSKTPYPVIDIMASQKKITSKGGTMRLGIYPCTLKPGTKVFEAYLKTDIKERHRHRYEFNNKYLEAYENAGMMAVGINPKDNLVEVVELTDHPWFVGVQFHPEYQSTVANPHPLFEGFVKAAIDYKQKVQ